MTAVQRNAIHGPERLALPGFVMPGYVSLRHSRVHVNPNWIERASNDR